MESKFNTIRQKVGLEKQAVHNENSKDRLKKEQAKKLRTTMIGALSIIEKEMGFLWGINGQGNDDENEREMKEIFDRVRSQILDLGNNQIRNSDTEIDQYEIKWNRYHLDLPVRVGGKNDQA